MKKINNKIITNRQLFLQNLAQTSNTPLLLEIEKAEGIYLYDVYGKKYFDLISGISVSNVGHRHPKVVEAIKQQLDNYMHLMVYGEYIQSPQVKYAELLTKQLPENLSSVYFTNSGSEANEGALKLAKRVTGRSEIISFKNAYHGSTHGALSIMGNEYFKQAFRPLLPDIKFIEFNNEYDLNLISEKTACVIVEPIQGEAGVICPNNNYLQKLRKKCTKTGTLLIFDEVQTGFGRTGHLFAFQKYNVIPDILTIAKGMGGGMPIGAFISSKEIMNNLSFNPVLGHITTFGGHPVSAAAALASLEILLEENLIEKVEEKSLLFKKELNHKLIKKISGEGLLLSIDFENEILVQNLIQEGIKDGYITDWFLFDAKKCRLAPPLTITTDEIYTACKLINYSLNKILSTK
jgi:acetylornithine/succinyldiaminopimelate/putrescine aminotransferase